MGFSNDAVGGITLVRQAIQSPNFVHGSAGWTVNIDGSAEFNNLAIRGTFSGSDYIINSSGMFFYSGTPAAGNLVISITPAAGTDGFGNAYPAGLGFQGFSPNQISWPITSGPGQTLYEIGVIAGTTTYIILGGSNAISGVSVWVSSAGVIFAQQPGAQAPETWHAFSLASGWSAGTDINGTSYPPAYKLLPDGSVALKGTLVTPTTGSVTGVTFGTVPAAYTPSTNIPTATVANTTGGQVGQVYIRPNGNVQLGGGFLNGASVRLDSIIQVNGV